MSWLCIMRHKWTYNISYYLVEKQSQERHCLRCDKHEHYRHGTWMEDFIKTKMKLL